MVDARKQRVSIILRNPTFLFKGYKEEQMDSPEFEIGLGKDYSHLPGKMWFGCCEFADIMEGLVEYGSVGLNGKVWKLEGGILTCSKGLDSQLSLHDSKNFEEVERIFDKCESACRSINYNACYGCRLSGGK